MVRTERSKLRCWSFVRPYIPPFFFFIYFQKEVLDRIKESIQKEKNTYWLPGFFTKGIDIFQKIYFAYCYQRPLTLFRQRSKKKIARFYSYDFDYKNNIETAYVHHVMQNIFVYCLNLNRYDSSRVKKKEHEF